MGVNLVLFGGFLATALGLFIIEAYTVATGQPTISERIQALGRSAPLVVVVVSTFVGMMLVHFFG